MLIRVWLVVGHLQLGRRVMQSGGFGLLLLLLLFDKQFLIRTRASIRINLSVLLHHCMHAVQAQ